MSARADRIAGLVTELLELERQTHIVTQGFSSGIPDGAQYERELYGRLRGLADHLRYTAAYADSVALGYRVEDEEPAA